MFMTLRDRVERFTDFSNLSKDWEYVFAGYEKDTTKLLEMGGDADAILADAITPVPKELIEAMPNLKIIHSEGVGYEGINLACDYVRDKRLDPGERETHRHGEEETHLSDNNSERNT